MRIHRLAWAAVLLAGCATPRHERAAEDLEDLGPAPRPAHASSPGEPSRDAPAEDRPEPAEPDERANEDRQRLESLSDLLVRAQRHSPELREAWHRAVAAARRIPASAKPPEPTVTWGAFVRSVETRVGPQEQSLGLRQRIPWPTKLTRAADHAAARAKVLRRRFEARRLALLRSIRRPWAMLAWIARARDLLESEIEILEQLESSVRSRMTTGEANYENLLRVSMRVEELEERKRSLADRAPALRAKIRSRAGLSDDTELPEPDFEDGPGELPSAATLREELEDNPDLDVAVAKLEQARARVAETETKGLPDFTVGLDWIAVDDVGVGGGSAGKDAVRTMVGVSVPIWRGAYDARESAARAEKRAAEARRDEVLRRAEAELARIRSTVREQRRKKALYADQLVPDAQSALDAARTAYANGRRAFPDVIELERRLMSYELAELTARRELARAQADLDWLVGREVTR